MTVQHRISKILSTLLIAGLCSAPLLRAQQTNPTTAQQPQQPSSTQPAQTDPTQTSPAQPANTSAAPAQNAQPAAPAGQNQPQQPAGQQSANPGTSVNPSQAPLQPVTTYPDAAGAQQEQQS